MAEQSPLNDEERADLIAYLDGELDENAAQAVASRLSRDPQARAEAAALSRAWDMLDYLPQPEPSPNFTHRTVERLSALRTMEAPARRRRSWVLVAGWVAALLLAAGLGYSGMTFFRAPDRTDEELTRDLRILENKRLYDPVEDMDFLLELSNPELFGDEGAGG